MIDLFQNVVSVLMHQRHNLDHAHALAFKQWISCFTSTDITFTTHALHFVTLTSGPARMFVATLHVAYKKTQTGFRLTHLVYLPMVRQTLSSPPPFCASTRVAQTTLKWHGEVRPGVLNETYLLDLITVAL
jgi:hypothetical protein